MRPDVEKVAQICPNVAQKLVITSVMFVALAQNHTFWLKFFKKLSPRTFENRPIWSHLVQPNQSLIVIRHPIESKSRCVTTTTATTTLDDQSLAPCRVNVA